MEKAWSKIQNISKCLPVRMHANIRCEHHMQNLLRLECLAHSCVLHARCVRSIEVDS